jgi:hypothetical protein
LAATAPRNALAYGTTPASREDRAPVRDLHIAPLVLAGMIRNAFAGHGAERTLLRAELGTLLKRFGAPNVRNIPLSRIRGIDEARVDGPVVRHDALVITALASILECDTIFAFGATAHDTAAVLTHNLPEARIYTLVTPEPQPLAQARTHSAPLAANVMRLTGSAGTFDLSPYSGTSDLVLIDPSDAPSDIRDETDAAFSLLSELGTIVWDNYTQSAAAYAYLNALAPDLDRPLFHLLGTRLALYSRWDIVRPDD